MANLDQTSADASAGYSLNTRDRLTTITSDQGGVTTISYTGEESACSSGDFPSLWANADRCYPDYWYTDPLADTETLDWYNLYAESTVTQTDATGGGKPVVTAYSYGPPGWHYDNDEVSRSTYPTWDEWRGFRTVTIETGTPPDPVTETISTYYQGLSDDTGPYVVTGGYEGNGTVTLTTNRGISVEDQDQDAGELLETRVFDGAGGSEVTDTEDNVPAWSEETASETEDSALDQYIDAYLTDNGGEDGGSETITYTDLASGGTDETVTTSSYDTSGTVDAQDYKPWGAAETCTATSYVTNTTSNLSVSDPSGSPHQGEPVTIAAASGTSQGEDWFLDEQDPVVDFYEAGLMSAEMNLHWGSDEAYEIDYVPDGDFTGLCMGTTTSNGSGAVTLQPCGETAATLWVADTADQDGRAVPLINGNNNNFAYPYSLEAGSPGARLTSSELLADPDSPPSSTQEWGTIYGVL